MMDQKSKFTPYEISAEFVGEAQEDDVTRRVVHGQIQLSPENLICNPTFRNMLVCPIYKELLVGLVVDEAHCVKTW